MHDPCDGCKTGDVAGACVKCDIYKQALADMEAEKQLLEGEMKWRKT